MRSKDTLVLEKLYSKVLMEKFYSYDPPQDKKTLMYDFYVINYLQFLLTLPSQGFRDLSDDIAESVKTAAQKLYPYLKKELLDAVFYSICAEWRHFSDYSENYQRIENMYGDKENITKFFNLYDRYRKFYKKNSKEQEELTKIFGVEKPSAQNRPPEIEKKEGLADRVTSYKAVNYALEQTGMSRAFFVSLARDCYIKLIWGSSYGGDAWCGICKGWLLLDAAEKMEASAPVSTKTPEAEVKGRGEESEYYKQKAEKTKKKEAPVETKQLDIPAAIDHIYDLQHNTDTVFNKLRSYYKGGYGWIEQALTDKANVKTYFELLKKTSGTVRVLAPPVLYNKLGQTWESATKDKTPDSNSGIRKIKSKETKCGDIPRYQEKRKSEPEKDPFDQGNIPVSTYGNDIYVLTKDVEKLFKMTQGDLMKIKEGYYVLYNALTNNQYEIEIFKLKDKKNTDGSDQYDLVANIPPEENPSKSFFNWAKIINDEIKKYKEKNKPDSSPKTSDQYSSSKFHVHPELINFIQMPEDSFWKIGDNYGLTKDTLVAGKDQPFGGVDMGMSIQVHLLEGGELFEKIGKPFKIPTSLKDLDNQEKLTLVKYVKDSIYKHKNKILSQDLRPGKISEAEVKQLLDTITMGGIYGLKNGFYMKTKEGVLPQITQIQVWGPNGFVTLAGEVNAKSKIKELTKRLNDNISSETDTQSNQGSSSSKTEAYVNDDDVSNLVKAKIQGETYLLKDGYSMKWREYPNDPEYFEIWVVNPDKNTINKIKEAKGDFNPGELAKMINNYIKVDVAKGGLAKKGLISPSSSSDKDVYVTPDDISKLTKMIEGETYVLWSGYSMKWREYPDNPQYYEIFVVDSTKKRIATINVSKGGFYSDDPKELAKTINDYIKIDVFKKGSIPSSPSSSSASDILNQGVYVTGSDIESLLKKSPNEAMELKDGFHISYWKSSAVPSQKGMLQFRVFKKLKDGDYKLIHNMTDMKKGNNAVATEINNAIKEYIKENPTSKSYDPTKSPGYVPSAGFSPTMFKQPEQEEEEPEYSIDEEEDIEEDYINVKAIKFVFYSGKLDLGNGYMAVTGPKLQGTTPNPDPFKMLEIKKGKKVIFSDRVYESDVEDKFQKLKTMAETINNKIKEEEGDMDFEHSMSGMTSDPSPAMQMMDLDYIIKMPVNSPYDLENGFMLWKTEADQKGYTNLVVSKKAGGKHNIIMNEPFDFPNANKWETSYKKNLIKYINNIIKDNLNESFKNFFFRTV